MIRYGSAWISAGNMGSWRNVSDRMLAMPRIADLRISGARQVKMLEIPWGDRTGTFT